MMRIAVTGSMGQVATSLIEQAGRAFEIVLLGRRVFLLEDRAAVLNGLKAARPDVVINAALYRRRPGRGARGSLAVAINGAAGPATWRGSRRPDRRASAAAVDRLRVRRRP